MVRNALRTTGGSLSEGLISAKDILTLQWIVGGSPQLRAGSRSRDVSWERRDEGAGPGRLRLLRADVALGGEGRVEKVGCARRESPKVASFQQLSPFTSYISNGLLVA